MRALSDEQVRLLRLRAQGLEAPRAADVHGVVRAAAGLQAQDLRASWLQVRARSRGLTAADVRRATDRDRSVVRTWALRGTLHALAAQDVRWLVALLGPTWEQRGRRRRAQLGLDDATCGRALAAVEEILEEATAPPTRAELIAAANAEGAGVQAAGQAPAHLLALAAHRGLVVRAADRGAEPTYALARRWLPEQPDREPADALAELARRHVSAFGPSDAADLATWAGVSLGLARRGLAAIRDELEPVEVRGAPAWLPAGTAGAQPRRDPVVRLLGAFDTWLLGVRDRSLALDPRHARAVQAGGGWLHPTLVVDGLIAGTWRHPRGTGLLTVQPFGPLGPGLLPHLEAEAADVGRFLGSPARLEVGHAGPRTTSP